MAAQARPPGRRAGAAAGARRGRCPLRRLRHPGLHQPRACTRRRAGRAAARGPPGHDLPLLPDRTARLLRRAGCTVRRRLPADGDLGAADRAPRRRPADRRHEPALPGPARRPRPDRRRRLDGPGHVRRSAGRRGGRRAATGRLRRADGRHRDARSLAMCWATAPASCRWAASRPTRGLPSRCWSICWAARCSAPTATAPSRCSPSPQADPVPGFRAALDGRRMPGDGSKARRAAAIAPGTVELPDDLWAWLDGA